MTKQEIITAAAHIIQSEGYDMLTMSSLAQALDVRKASLYYHFDGKEKLIDAIYDHYERECLHDGLLDGSDTLEEHLHVSFPLPVHIPDPAAQGDR